MLISLIVYHRSDNFETRSQRHPSARTLGANMSLSLSVSLMGSVSPSWIERTSRGGELIFWISMNADCTISCLLVTNRVTQQTWGTEQEASETIDEWVEISSGLDRILARDLLVEVTPTMIFLVHQRWEAFPTMPLGHDHLPIITFRTSVWKSDGRTCTPYSLSIVINRASEEIRLSSGQLVT